MLLTSASVWGGVDKSELVFSAVVNSGTQTRTVNLDNKYGVTLRIQSATIEGSSLSLARN
jgi:hypothetical protein